MWYEDLINHIDFEDWQFISRNTKSYEDIDKKKPFVCFASFQDFLGKNSAGGIKIKINGHIKSNGTLILMNIILDLGEEQRTLLSEMMR